MNNLQKIRSQLHGWIAPTKELQSFLIFARYECIESVMIDDLNVKIQLLQEKPEFQKQLRRFKVTKDGISVGLKWAIKLLEKENKIFVDRHQELTLTMVDKDRSVVLNAQTPKEHLHYLHMAQAYRDLSMDETKRSIQKKKF